MMIAGMTLRYRSNDCTTGIYSISIQFHNFHNKNYLTVVPYSLRWAVVMNKMAG